jgi:hypothetical protein
MPTPSASAFPATEYLRRELGTESRLIRKSPSPISSTRPTVFANLNEPDVMSGAWS